MFGGQRPYGCGLKQRRIEGKGHPIRFGGSSQTGIEVPQGDDKHPGDGLQ